MCDANGAKDLKMLPSNKRVGDVTDEVNEWLAPDPNVCESIDLYQRNTWFKDLCKGLAKDPTTSFIGSGDRVMIASIDEVKDGTVWATIEDCIITRRRHVKLSCNMTPELNPENFVAKTALSSALADAQRHLSKLDPQGMSYNSIAGWRDEMKSWLDEIDQLTLAEPK
jgi:hypothetical protein